jgi:molecular chaperone GrpE
VADADSRTGPAPPAPPPAEVDAVAEPVTVDPSGSAPTDPTGDAVPPAPPPMEAEPEAGAAGGVPVDAEDPVTAEAAGRPQPGADAGAPIAPPEAQAVSADEAAADAFAGMAEEHPVLQEDSDVAAAAVEVDLEVARMAAERDEYLEALRRLQADFENYKKRTLRQQTETLERAGEDLVLKLLPVLDTIDLARQHGAGDAVEQVAGALVEVLAKEGLERLDPLGQPFDPTEHDAVAHEDGDGEPEVVEVMRAGYRWRGRLVRPAMVKVKG